MASLAVTSSMLKTSVKFQVLLLNSGYAPGSLEINGSGHEEKVDFKTLGLSFT